jgi:translation elongation factor EF-4
MTPFTEIHEVTTVNIDPKNSQTKFPYYKFEYRKYQLPWGEVVESFHRHARFRQRGMSTWSYDSLESFQAAIKKTQKQFVEFN